MLTLSHHSIRLDYESMTVNVPVIGRISCPFAANPMILYCGG